MLVNYIVLVGDEYYQPYLFGFEHLIQFLDHLYKHVLHYLLSPSGKVLVEYDMLGYGGRTCSRLNFER